MKFLATLTYTLFYTLLLPVTFVYALAILTLRMWAGMLVDAISEVRYTWVAFFRYPDLGWRDVAHDVPHMVRHELKEPFRAGTVGLL